MLRTQTYVDTHLFRGGECARALRLLCAMAELGFIFGGVRTKSCLLPYIISFNGCSLQCA